jgi:hypothetical protein
MRYFISYCFIIVTTWSCLGQERYIPFIGAHKYWIYSQNDGADIPQSVGAFMVTFGTDTLMNGLNYTKLLYVELNGAHPCPAKPCFVPYYPYQISASDRTVLAYIREDTLNKEVYCMPALNYDAFCDTKEHLLLDFNQKVGDTITACNLRIHSGWPISNQYFTIDSIKMEEVYGNNRKTFYFNGYQYGGLPFISSLRFMEGVGLENNLIFYVDQKVKFVDFCEGTLAACNIISSSKEVPLDVSIKIAITPNPTANFIKLS